MDPFLGEIRPFGFDFAPHGWAQCNGQILSIAQNTALFSLLGTTYGGNGQTTFALPDLRGRTAISSGQGGGLASYSLGQVGGLESVTLNVNEMPAHNHNVNVTNQAGSSPAPAGLYPAKTNTAAYKAGPSGTMAADELGNAGSNQPHTNLQPTLAVNYCIALQGIFPSRN
jgi:microcystin-dependent protein